MRISDWSSDVCSSDLGFADDIGLFDFVLLAGRKIEQRLLERQLIRRGDYATGVYAKFDWMNPRAGERLFDNDRPTVLYTPHFRPALSSWPKWGMAVLDLFANSRSEEHTSELQSLMRNSYVVFCVKKNNT